MTTTNVDNLCVFATMVESSFDAPCKFGSSCCNCYCLYCHDSNKPTAKDVSTKAAKDVAEDTDDATKAVKDVDSTLSLRMRRKFWSHHQHEIKKVNAAIASNRRREIKLAKEAKAADDFIATITLEKVRKIVNGDTKDGAEMAELFGEEANFKKFTEEQRKKMLRVLMQHLYDIWCEVQSETRDSATMENCLAFESVLLPFSSKLSETRPDGKSLKICCNEYCWGRVCLLSHNNCDGVPMTPEVQEGIVRDFSASDITKIFNGPLQRKAALVRQILRNARSDVDIRLLDEFKRLIILADIKNKVSVMLNNLRDAKVATLEDADATTTDTFSLTSTSLVP
jgi:hypothetical protein